MSNPIPRPVAARSGNPVDAHVGARVRLRRRLLGLTQVQLAEALGLTFQQVQKYERGINRVSASRLHDMATVLGVPESFFFEDMPVDLLARAPSPTVEAAPLPPSSSAEHLSTAETLSLVKAYYRIADPRLRRRVCDLARALGESESTG